MLSTIAYRKQQYQRLQRLLIWIWFVKRRLNYRVEKSTKSIENFHLITFLQFPILLDSAVMYKLKLTLYTVH